MKIFNHVFVKSVKQRILAHSREEHFPMLQTMTVHERKLAAERRRLANLAIELQDKFSPVEAAQLLLGAGSGLLTHSHGRAAASRYLSELAECV
jgi:CMP-N-acetylneuraminic acid synthetase